MPRDFHQTDWDAQVAEDCRQLVLLAMREDLADQEDWTTNSLVDPAKQGRVVVAAREAGVIAGLRAAEIVLSEMGTNITWKAEIAEGDIVPAGATLATMEGPVRELLTCERTVLNFLGRLSGIATQTHRYVDRVKDFSASIYDTRKTTPGWRRLEKYAVRCGGGTNHRTGLFDAVLIKDNHLASGETGTQRFTPAEAVQKAREFVGSQSPSAEPMIVEIEVDTLGQLEEVLPAGPDIVLLDNMAPDRLREAVAMRDRLGPGVQLESSGGVTLEALPQIAASGVDRISIGALTHQAVWLDVGLDWGGN